MVDRENGGNLAGRGSAMDKVHKKKYEFCDI